MILENIKTNAERTGEIQFSNAVYTIWDNNMSV
jgi:hypothetical protein